MINKGKSQRRLAAAVCAASASVLLVLFLFVACVETTAFDRGFYKSEYDKVNTAAYVGVDSAVLTETTELLLGYLQGKNDSLDYAYPTARGAAEYYTAREKAHMVDVRQLNRGAVTFAWIALPASVALFAAAYFLNKDNLLLFKTTFISTLCAIGFFAAVGMLAAMDFNAFWINFHYLFFTNDLWQLDPGRSLMIKMFSEQFFFDMVTRILTWFLLLITGLLIISGLLWRKFKKKELITG